METISDSKEGRYQVLYTNQAVGQIDCCVFSSDDKVKALIQCTKYKSAKVVDSETGKSVTL